MTVVTPVDLVLAHLLVLTRIAAFVAIAPPFSSRAIPTRIKAMISFGLALPLTPQSVGQFRDATAGPLASAVAFNMIIGLALGFTVLLLFSAVQAAGELIDLFSMFTMASLLDPISNSTSSMFGRVQLLIGTTLMFAGGGVLLLIHGLGRTFSVVPVREQQWGRLAELMTTNLSVFFVSAVEIAGPIILVLFIVDVAMGLVSRAVPSLNVFQLNFPVKTLLTVSLATVAVALLPGALAAVVERILKSFGPATTYLGG